MLDVGCSPLLANENHRTHFLTRNLSMRFPGELRIKMNGSPMNKENIQPVFAMDGLRRGEHPTPKAFASKASNIEPSTDYGAFL
jgi:hypothetical protein